MNTLPVRGPYRVSFLILVVVMSGVIVGACSPSPPPTLDKIWTEYKQSYRQYHDGLYQFGSKQWPEFKEPLSQQRELELTELELRDYRFKFLRENHPGRLSTDRDIHELVQFQWPTRFDTELAEVHPETRELKERLERMRSELRSDEKWSTIRERFQNLPRDSQYFELNRQLQQDLDQLDEQLKRWRRHRES